MASDHKPRASGHAFLPAAGWHFLTPCYDLLCAVAGLGPRFKARVMDAAAVAERARVLDVGCGTSVLAALLKRQAGGRHSGLTRTVDMPWAWGSSARGTRT